MPGRGRAGPGLGAGPDPALSVSAASTTGSASGTSRPSSSAASRLSPSAATLGRAGPAADGAQEGRAARHQLLARRPAMRAPPGARVGRRYAVVWGGRRGRAGDRLACPGPRAGTPGKLLAGLAVSSRRRVFLLHVSASPLARRRSRLTAGLGAVPTIRRTLRAWPHRGQRGWCWLWVAQTPCPPPLRNGDPNAADFGKTWVCFLKKSYI